jgi:hypothetical protein
MSPANDSIRTNPLWQKDKDRFLHPWTHFDFFLPPLIFTREQCDTLVDTLREAICEVTRELERERYLQ